MNPKSAYDFGSDEYAAHRNAHWLAKAANPRLPLTLRVYFAGLGNRRIGGHAPFTRAAPLVDLLVEPGGVRPDRRRISEAIRQCIEWGYLAEGSNALCLIVPLEDVQGGRTDYRCRRGHKTRQAQDHKPECRCPRCLKVSVPERTLDPEVSASRQDTSTSGVRAQTDTLSGGSLLYLPTGASAPERTGEEAS